LGRLMSRVGRILPIQNSARTNNSKKHLGKQQHRGGEEEKKEMGDLGPAPFNEKLTQAETELKGPTSIHIISDF